jgi:hypothetical integral membrane protein (TIGR02206 family)
MMQNFFYTSDTVPEGLGISHYGIEHLCWLAAAVAFIVGISLLYRKADTKLRRRIQVVMACLIVLEEVTRDVFLAVTGQFAVSHLPLHLCSVNIILIAVHACKRTKTVDNFLYGICIPGAAAALLFANWLELPVWNYMSIHSFTVHILLVAYPVMMTVGGELQPNVKQLPKCVLLVLGLAVPIYIFNSIFDTNFMFLMYGEEGTPLVFWFQEHMGTHLPGLVILAAIALTAMYTILFVCRKLAAKQRKSLAA